MGRSLDSRHALASMAMVRPSTSAMSSAERCCTTLSLRSQSGGTAMLWHTHAALRSSLLLRRKAAAARPEAIVANNRCLLAASGEREGRASRVSCAAVGLRVCTVYCTTIIVSGASVGCHHQHARSLPCCAGGAAAAPQSIHLCLQLGDLDGEGSNQRILPRLCGGGRRGRPAVGCLGSCGCCRREM